MSDLSQEMKRDSLDYLLQDLNSASNNIEFEAIQDSDDDSPRFNDWSARNSILEETNETFDGVNTYKITEENDLQPIVPPKLESPSLILKAIPSTNPAIKKIKNLSRNKSSSTSSLYTDASTISSPDTDEVLKCMSIALYWNIKNNENLEVLNLPEFWSEERHPLDRNISFQRIPTQEEILHFITLIFRAESLSAETGVMCMAYVNRLLETQNISLYRTNWRRIILGALMLASKVWEDQAVWNADFLNVFPRLSVDELNEIERHYLNALHFNVSLSAAAYAKYYFELKSLSPSFPLQPLSTEGKEKIEAKSSGIEAKEKKILRAQSVDMYRPKSRPVIID